MRRIAPLLLFALPTTLATLIPPRSADEPAHTVKRDVLYTWYHRDEHPVHALFKRATTDGSAYAVVGTPTWSSPYPKSSPDVNSLPQAWVDALHQAISAGKIPNIPQSTNTPGTSPVYPDHVNPMGLDVCSATYQCRNANDIWDAPDGIFGSSFDDGPLPPSTKLINFLSSQNLTSTQFMIGKNILTYPTQFQEAFNAGHDIGVHTWTHPYMTTLSNEQIVGELGWTMQLIHNSTGGRVPKYWRPPYGDADNRVRAIAKEIFDLDTVIWNKDTSDWQIPSGVTTEAAVKAKLHTWVSGPKSPGLIILEHVTNDNAVDAFITEYPEIVSNNWKFASVAEIARGSSAYQNAQNSVSNVAPAGILPDDGNSGNASNSVSVSGSTSSNPIPTQKLGANSSPSSSFASPIFGYLDARLYSALLCVPLLLNMP